ncbi:MAG: AsmA family protein, partial [Rhodospirillales bacterium]|nr:AsmA family protein [Rhodospirillales bacterium]
MRKVLIGAVVLFVILIGAVIVAPGFIDWNHYKDQIAARIHEATGRRVHFDGDISATLLPAPALIAERVRLSNVDGAAVADMVSLRSLVVRVAMGPLLGGNIQVEALRLVDPVIELETLADGRQNWAFQPAQKPEGATTTPATSQEASKSAADSVGDLPVRIDSFVIDNGTLVYRDAKAGTVERVSSINARVVAASLLGPFDATGAAVIRGIPVDLEVSIGRMIQGRTVPFTLNAGLSDTAKARFTGALVLTDDTPKLRGDILAEGSRLADAVGIISGGGTLPGILGQSFALKSAISATAERLDMTEIDLRLGSTQAGGNAHLKLDAKVPQFRAAINVKRIDLDEWIALPAIDVKGLAKAAVSTSEDGKASIALRNDSTPPAGQGTSSGTKANASPLPKNINAALELGVEALSYKGGVITQAKANVALTEGEFIVNQISALLPGGGEAATFGFVTLEGGNPKYEGEVEANVGDLQGIMRWLGAGPLQVPADRLRKLSARGKVSLTPEQIQVAGLSAAFDSSHVKGGVTLALTDRLSFGADLSLDRINVDAYLLPPPATAGKPSPAVGDKAPTGVSTTQPSTKAPIPSFFSAFSALTGFDANLRMAIGEMTVNGISVKNTRFDGTLFNSALTIRDASVGGMAGASASIKGTLNGLGGIPSAKGITIAMATADTIPLFRLAGITPIPALTKGKIAVNGAIDGSLVNPTVKLDIDALGGVFGLAGTLSPFDLMTGLELDTTIQHPDPRDLIRRLGAGYSPQGPIGAMDIKARVKANADTLALNGLSGHIGTSAISGQADVRLAGPKPVVNASLVFGDLVIDPYLPQEGQKAGKTNTSATSRSQPSRGGASTQGAERWSRDPIDLSGMATFNATLNARAQSMTYRH